MDGEVFEDSDEGISIAGVEASPPVGGDAVPDAASGSGVEVLPSADVWPEDASVGDGVVPSLTSVGSLVESQPEELTNAINRIVVIERVRRC
ncbi:hypothetical protein N9239_00610 [bacterium]|nr:hypothetical protein [bacterium]MDB4474966.1 hypothetical protein [bacterium]MDB4500498.1 hypothetical protein [bacterium]MDB4770552.1 hypothetical protein [bacterium]